MVLATVNVRVGVAVVVMVAIPRATAAAGERIAGGRGKKLHSRVRVSIGREVLVLMQCYASGRRTSVEPGKCNVRCLSKAATAFNKVH